MIHEKISTKNHNELPETSDKKSTNRIKRNFLEKSREEKNMLNQILMITKNRKENRNSHNRYIKKIKSIASELILAHKCYHRRRKKYNHIPQENKKQLSENIYNKAPYYKEDMKVNFIF